MRTATLLLSAIHFFVVLLILAGGAFLLAVPSFPHVHALIIDVITTKSELLKLAGYGFLLIGAMLFFGFYALYRRQYFQLSMSPTSTIDLSLIREYMDRYWQELFPNENLTTDVIIHPDQKIELIAEMPDAVFNKQKSLLEKVEGELGDLLAKKLGYEKEFLVTILLKPTTGSSNT